MSITNVKEQIKKINNDCVNKNIILTRSIFLRSVALIYLFAFISLYFQIQGLWGEEGLLPASFLLEKIGEKYKENASFLNFPALLWFHERINTYFLKFVYLIFLPFQSFENFSSNIPNLFTTHTSVDNAMFIICLVGIIFSTGVVLNFSFAYNSFGFFVMWICYLNFFIVGQVFMSFQWDIFLLEIGFLTIFLSPWTKDSLDVITPSDELVFHLFRFLMFRFIYSNGIVKITANCPAWLSFNTLNFHFQSQPLPNFMSYYAHVFLPEGIKKMLTAFTFFLEIYVPFLFFLFFRRFNLFAGVLQNVLQIGIIFTGNYNFFNFLTIVLNLSNFDDKYLRTFFPQSFLNFFELDPLNKIYEYLLNEENFVLQENIEKSESAKKEEGEKQEKEEKENTPTDSEEKSNEKKQDITSILKDKKLRKIYETDQYDANDPKNFFSRESMLFEFTLFTNLFLICVMITFYFIYPLKELLPGHLRISTKDIQSVYNQGFLNFYILFIFVYIVINYSLHFYKTIKDRIVSHLMFASISHLYPKKSLKQKITNGLLFVFSIIKNILFFIFFLFYYINATNVFYNSLDFQLVNKESNNDVENFLNKGVEIADNLFTRFRINHGYGLFRVMTGLNGRPELEIKIYNNNKWENLNFLYKMNDGENFNLKWNIPHQPRIDWQIWFSALADNINTEPWLVILLGKILEKNPVTLNLLGYQVDEMETYYKYSLFDKIVQNVIHKKERAKLDYVPSGIKVDSYLYSFSTKMADIEMKKFWNKKFVKEFLPPIQKHALQEIFEWYGLPKIDSKRKIEISPFQLIPIVDLLFLIAFIKYLFK